MEHHSHHLLDQEEILCLEDCLELAQTLESLSRGQYQALTQRLSLRLIWCLSRRFPSPESLSQYQAQARRLRQALAPTQNPDLLPSLGGSLSAHQTRSHRDD